MGLTGLVSLHEDEGVRRQSGQCGDQVRCGRGHHSGCRSRGPGNVDEGVREWGAAGLCWRSALERTPVKGTIFTVR